MSLLEAQTLAAAHQGHCLSKKYKGDNRTLKWICSQDHIWYAPLKMVRQGAWCANCEKLEAKQKKNAEILIIAKQIAKAKGGECLADAFINSLIRMPFRCANNHTWRATYQSLKNGSWCKQCSIQNRIPLIEKYQKKAIARGGKLLSETFKNTKITLSWQCSKGHQWKASANKINIGLWCPVCEKENKAEAMGKG